MTFSLTKTFHFTNICFSFFINLSLMFLSIWPNHLNVHPFINPKRLLNTSSGNSQSLFQFKYCSLWPVLSCTAVGAEAHIFCKHTAKLEAFRWDRSSKSLSCQTNLTVKSWVESKLFSLVKHCLQGKPETKKILEKFVKKRVVHILSRLKGKTRQLDAHKLKVISNQVFLITDVAWRQDTRFIYGCTA